jgi:amidase
MPFAPTFDTVGILARSADVLERAASVLLAGSVPTGSERPTIHLLEDAFALAEPEVRQVLETPIERLRALFDQRVRTVSLQEICGDTPGGQWETWLDTYCVLQWSEVGSSLAAWIAAERPQFGPATAGSFKLVHDLDRRRVRETIARREACYRDLRRVLGPRDLLCIPTVPYPAPAKASNAQDRTGGYYRKTLSLTSLSGIGRLPQVTLPVARVAASPVGLSLIGAQGEDLFLIGVAAEIGRELGIVKS